MLLIGTIKQYLLVIQSKASIFPPRHQQFPSASLWKIIGVSEENKCGIVMMASKYAYNVNSMARKGYVLLEDVDVCIVLDQYSQFHCRARSQNKLSTDRHVAPLGLRVNQSLLWLLNAVCSMKHRISIVYSLVWADRWGVYYNI